MKPTSFDTLASLLRLGSGLVIGPDKTYLLETRLVPVLRKHGIATIDDAAARLRFNPQMARIDFAQGSLELDIIEAMTTNESLFFRDDKPFTHLRTSGIPRLLAARPASAGLRVWSAAASSGQEAYSLAMLWTEMRATVGSRPIEIVGTDIAREQLSRARDGLYSQFEVQRGLPMQYLVKYFTKEDHNNWRISPKIRAMAQFQVLNLLGDLRSMGQFDVVFCRNVLIYFDQPTKTKVLEAIARQMPADGLLYLGGAETVLGITDAFTSVPGERGVYERSKTNAKTPFTGRAATVAASA
jgi:chemotaxis protein methyltransferase CheR